MPSKWINFKELRERLNVAEVLASYNVSVKVKGDQGQGFCPLPAHPAHDGKRKSPSFSIHLKRGIFQCFSCHASGNCLDLVCLLEGMDPKVPGDIRKAALLLEERYPATGQLPLHPPAKSAAVPKPTAKVVATMKAAAEKEGTVIVNAPLDFELKHLDPNHPYLASRGFTPETIQHFGLGYCAKGMMAGRIAIPLHDATGNLIGYAGRLVDDATISEENPKYRFPGTRERQGIAYEFHKSAFLYNGHRIEKPADDLVVVEGFASVWWLWQHGHRNVVGLMGSNAAARQKDLLHDLLGPNGRLWILTDSDPAGEGCARDLCLELSPERFVRWVKLEQGQPTDLSAEELTLKLG